MRLFSVVIITGAMTNHDAGIFWQTHRCTTHQESPTTGGYMPNPDVCVCPAPRNWFFPYEIRYTRKCQDQGVMGIAPPIRELRYE